MRPTQLRLLVAFALCASPVLAQTSAPAQSSDGMGTAWLWIVMLLVIAGAAIWYFGFRNKGSGTSSMGMDSDRLSGSAKQAKGSMKDGAGNILGDTKLQAEGKLDKAEGKAQNTLGGIKDRLRGE